MPDPCIICGDIVDSHVDCEECQEAVYCSSECHATDGLHKLLCYGHHPFESRPCSDMVRGIFFGAEATIPRFTWVPSSNYGATVGHIEKLLGTVSRSFPIEANPIRNRIIDEPIRCFQSVPGASRRNNNAITSIISKCKRWNGNIPRSKRYNWTGHVLFMGDNRDLTYQDFRHIIDDISVYRSGSNNDRSLWEERAKRIHGVQLQIETFRDGLDETCRTVFYPQDHPFFLDPNSRPQAPDFSIIKKLELPIIIEETTHLRNFISPPFSTPFPQWEILCVTAMRHFFIRNVSGVPAHFDAKFVRVDGKNLSADHVSALVEFIQRKILPFQSTKSLEFFEDVANAVIERATRAEFEAFWEKTKPGAYTGTLSSPYHDIEIPETTLMFGP